MTSTPDAPSGAEQTPTARRARGRGGLAVAVAFGAASLLGLVVVAVGGRWLDDSDLRAQFLALWSLVFGIGAALSAVEAETSRVASRATLEDRPVSSQVALVGGVGVVGGLLVLLVAACIPGIGPVVRDSPGTALATVAAVVLFVPLCVTRGVLLGTGAVVPYAGVVLGEALLRVLVLALLWVALSEASVVAAVTAVAAGGLAWVPVVRRVRSAVDRHSADRSLARAARAVGALGAANGLATLLLAAYPVLVATIVGGTRGLDTLFAAVILTRIPLVVVAPLQAVAVPWATRALHSGGGAGLRALWAKAAGGLVVLVGVAVPVGWYAGPWALRVFKGGGTDAEPLMMAVLLGATCVLAVALPQLAVVVAADQHARVTATWAVAVAAAAAWLAWGPGDGSTRGTVAFALGAGLVYAVSSLAVLDATRARPA